MRIEFSNNLGIELISAEGRELATIMGRDFVDGKRVSTYADAKSAFVHEFTNPVLVTDNYRIGQLEPALRDTLFSLFQQNKRTFTYGGTTVKFDAAQYPGVWSPSIDTVLFARALGGVLGEYAPRSVAEIGCGSGFLSKYALDHGNDISSVLINDFSGDAVHCAEDNIRDVRAEFRVGDGIQRIDGEQFDLLLCNPPYLPRPQSIDDNPYEGISLLHYLLHQGQEFLTENGRLIVNISSLCESIVLDGEIPMRMKEIYRMTVPLKVNNVLNNPEWMRYLTAERGLKKAHHDGYEYWQTLRIMELRK